MSLAIFVENLVNNWVFKVGIRIAKANRIGYLCFLSPNNK